MPISNGAEKQVIDAINKAHRILIVLPQNGSGDALGSGLALFRFFRRLEKEPELVCASDFPSFPFLPGVSEIQKTLQVFQSFVIAVDTKQTKLDELSYETKDDSVQIFLKPKNGRFEAKNITFKTARFPYDLIVTLDAPSLETLGAIYEKNTDLFFETPVVNIDHHPANDQYGEINLVDLTATSTAEILAGLIENFEENLMDQEVATNLLLGIIVETNSFQHVKTTPRAFLKASSLIAKGGDHKQIIRELYKTKQISLLKLWGRALARLKEEKDLSLAYALVNAADFAKTGAASEDTLGVMKELVANLAERKIIIFLAEIAPQDVVGYFHLHPTIKSQLLTTALDGRMLNGSLGTFKRQGQDLTQVEQEVLSKLAKIKEQIAV